jgi:hypothetical protein
MDLLPTHLENDVATSPVRPGIFRSIVLIAIGVLAWWLVYRNLADLSVWFTYAILPMEKGTRLAAAVEFFIFETELPDFFDPRSTRFSF